MKLIDVLMLMECEEYLPLTMTKTEHGLDLDSRPQSTDNVTICFMCEEETWVTCSIYSAILIPWYDCEVSAIHPNDDDTICVWLKDEEYILNNFKHCVRVKEGEKHEID